MRETVSTKELLIAIEGLQATKAYLLEEADVIENAHGRDKREYAAQLCGHWARILMYAIDDPAYFRLVPLCFSVIDEFTPPTGTITAHREKLKARQDQKKPGPGVQAMPQEDPQRRCASSQIF
jgi:hypothetical protein